MGERVGELSAFPSNGRRIIFYLYYDPQGIVDDYVPYKLERLRPFADHIFIVVNGHLTDEGRARLESVSDTLWQRENVGFDVWGYKEALAHFGEDKLAEYDELILMNYTWFGPVNPFEPVFRKMDALALDFWGMTMHDKQVPNPFTRKGVLHSHIQSHWIAVRKSMFLSEAWRSYWRDMPPIVSYVDSILSHESKFTHYFRTRGFDYEVAFPLTNYSTWHPAFYDAEALLDDGCPVLKRRPFFHDPLLLDRHSIVAKRFAEKASALGYPVQMIWRNISRNSQPKAFNTNAAMMEVMPDVVADYDEDNPLKIAVVAHIYYVDLTAEMLDYTATIPSDYDLFVTTTDETRANEIRKIMDEHEDPNRRTVEIRVLPSNRGRDMGAFFVGCADVISDDSYDVIFKIHSKRTEQEGKNAGDLFRRHQLMNLLNSRGYTSNLLGLFQREEGLGMVYAPTIHIGYPTLGRGWFGNKDAAKELADELGIHVPFDEPSPLAPYGCMFAFRPEALRLLTQVDWQYADFPSPKAHKDGSVAHIQERLFSYAVAELGFYTKTVATTRYAAISHTSLEYKLDRISANIQGYAIDQVHVLDASGDFLGGGPFGYALAYARLHYPRWYPLIENVYRPLRGVYRRTRYAIDPRYRRWRKSLKGSPVDEAIDEMDLL
ncbi:rhamnan synthesis F family protein [Microbacterium invictum]|uniref:Rhamnan synthesis F family protein n=1 Tax=Microbacterium invictum TaxID=515415 RepID=A0ABZ0V850_9MICO|nr:rhamnan synthesis F family protein [Microbacterium invictum]WQB69486.1 rhamnan synthesis F family protein [Microbacterium invictum]